MPGHAMGTISVLKSSTRNCNVRSSGIHSAGMYGICPVQRHCNPSGISAMPPSSLRLQCCCYSSINSMQCCQRLHRCGLHHHHHPRSGIVVPQSQQRAAFRYQPRAVSLAQPAFPTLRPPPVFGTFANCSVPPCKLMPKRYWCPCNCAKLMLRR